ncbi:TerB family tellurite resistance protein [Helicobacter sp. 11S03491-1]|uniref:TerB family tellurite resistance protein n=1 Tax=Helicobacter sp. 11S03491-1 TaxID=1476196 RepID=UPI000BA6BAF2|nr:TerB family tellurite resistance protein [Helicobacter sp. 11S03491-1]PAF41459.1 hypothetical protein BKH45_06980 [Helicobacter sp. 11S03491-1]
MEIVLLILAGVVVYYLYITLQEYLKNPISSGTRDTNTHSTPEYDLSQDPYILADPLEKIKKTEFGIMVSIMAKVVSKNKSLMKEVLIDEMFENMKNKINGIENAKEKLREVFGDKDSRTLEQLCKDFLQVTYGEYKKRLKFVEFLLSIAYAEGELDVQEKENIIDVAAFLELDNEGFNKIYDDFEIEFQTSIEMERTKALEILGLQEDFTQEMLDKNFEEAIRNSNQNILDPKYLNKSFASMAYRRLHQIQFAYDKLHS